MRVVTMVAVTRLASVPRLNSHDARGGCGSARTMRVQEVQLAPRHNYYIGAAPRIMFIYMAAALSAAGFFLNRFSRRRRQTSLVLSLGAAAAA